MITTRGRGVESVHYGSIAVVAVDGTLIRHAGDPMFVTFARSACKPFQAIPLLAHGAVERYGFTAKEIALICSSHSGETRHIQTVAHMLARTGCSEADLQCGTHSPLYYEAIGEPVPADVTFDALHHMCSGKHAGMLALARLMGASCGDYLNPRHPVQRAITRAVCYFSELAEHEIEIGIDGCSAPNFALPLQALAFAYAKLIVCDADQMYNQVPGRIFSAMTMHPEMVSGIKRADLILMQAGKGNLLTKIGAEGVQGMAIRSKGWGAAIKVADGASRALHVVAVEVLKQLGALEDGGDPDLANLGHPILRNCRGTQTGEVLPVFELT